MNPQPKYKGQTVVAHDVLDHGFVALRNLSGPTRRIPQDFDADDTDPANSARISFENMNSGRTRDADLKLCNYPMKNKHTTPIEMVEVSCIHNTQPIQLAGH